jgi:hypothetical protein
MNGTTNVRNVYVLLGYSCETVFNALVSYLLVVVIIVQFFEGYLKVLIDLNSKRTPSIQNCLVETDFIYYNFDQQIIHLY